LTGVNGPASVEIYNVLGQNIRSGELTGEFNPINLEEEASGVYFYRVVKENGSLVGCGKIVIEKK
jgi:Secretion system C-terminal sorting domain